METYKAVINEPNKTLPEPDKYGTMTIPGRLSTFGPSPIPLRAWAKQVLPKCASGSFCEIYRVEEVRIEIIHQEAKSAPAD